MNFEHDLVTIRVYNGCKAAQHSLRASGCLSIHYYSPYITHNVTMMWQEANLCGLHPQSPLSCGAYQGHAKSGIKNHAASSYFMVDPLLTVSAKAFMWHYVGAIRNAVLSKSRLCCQLQSFLTTSDIAQSPIHPCTTGMYE